MNIDYNTVRGEGKIIYEDRKSKFISRAVPVSKEAEAILYINKIRELHRDATQNVYAYSVYDGVLQQRFSDDGEPGGTSGKPTLEAITRLGVMNVVVVTTRYFGGTLLGAAGLMRAYGRSAQMAIEEAKIVRMVYRENIHIVCEYAYMGKLQNLVSKLGYGVAKLSYAVDVEMVIRVPEDKVDEFIKKVVDETNDRVLWEKAGGEFVVEEAT